MFSNLSFTVEKWESTYCKFSDFRITADTPQRSDPRLYCFLCFVLNHMLLFFLFHARRAHRSREISWWALLDYKNHTKNQYNHKEGAHGHKLRGNDRSCGSRKSALLLVLSSACHVQIGCHMQMARRNIRNIYRPLQHATYNGRWFVLAFSLKFLFISLRPLTYGWSRIWRIN